MLRNILKKNKENLIHEYILLSSKVSEIEKEITKIYQEYPKNPTKPIEPIKPDIYKNKKPNFFKFGGYIYYFFYISVPLFMILLFFSIIKEDISLAMLICASLPAIPLSYIYYLEKKLYNKEEKNNLSKINFYNNKIKEYSINYEQYKNKIIENKAKILELNKVDIIKSLENKIKIIISKIKPLIKEIDKLEGLNSSETVRYMFLTMRYNYLREKTYKREEFRVNDLENITDDNFNGENINKAKNYLERISSEKLRNILELLKVVEEIQKSNISESEKRRKIKEVLWTQHSASNKLWIGGVLGTLFGLLIFGTGGIGIAGLGSAFGMYGFLAGTTGGVLISSLIQNFENKK